MLFSQHSWYITACARLPVKACRQANSNHLKLSGRESAISRDSCLQHHTQENIWVLVVLAGNPDNAPVQNQLLATDHRKLNTHKKRANQIKLWKKPTLRDVEKYREKNRGHNAKKTRKIVKRTGLKYYKWLMTPRNLGFMLVWNLCFVVLRTLLKAPS